jgi:hypothetical protein
MFTACWFSAVIPARAQSHASVAGTYSGTEDSQQTLTWGGTSESITESYKISNVVFRQNGATFTYSAQTVDGVASSYTRTGTLSGNKIIALSGPVVIAVSPEIKVTRNEITSVDGTVSDGKIIIHMTGVAEGIYQGIKGRFDVRSTSTLYGPAAPVPDISITTHPQNRTVKLGETTAFTVAATGSSALSYQWQKDGVNLSNGGRITGVTTAMLTIANVQSTDAGSYSVKISSLKATVTSSRASLTVLVPPQITSPPQSATGTVGATAQFAVEASGSAPLSYQWRKDGINLANGGRLGGVTGPALTITGLQLTDAGVYTVIVSNAAGTVTSSGGTLSVFMPPAITQQPNPLTVALGAPAQFTVVASGSRPLRYQWRKDGQALPGQTSATLSLAAVQNSDAGAYDVVVSNGGGAITSESAPLTVLPSQPAVPLRLRIQWIDGAPHLTATGEAGATCTLECSQVVGQTVNWTGLTNLSLAGGAAQFVDRSAIGLPLRCYRLKRAP